MDVVRALQDKYDTSTEKEREQICPVLLILLLYTVIPPGRGREYRELKFLYHDADIDLHAHGSKLENVLHFSEYYGKAVLNVADHKTSSAFSPQDITIMDPVFLTILNEYVTRYRCTDLRNYDYLFKVSAVVML